MYNNNSLLNFWHTLIETVRNTVISKEMNWENMQVSIPIQTNYKSSFSQLKEQLLTIN